MEAESSKPDAYYSNDRKELIQLFDSLTNAAILDIGCGEGGLGKVLKSSGCGIVYGVETETTPALSAANVYDRVFNSKIEDVDLKALSGMFDFVVCADVLEHLVDPWNVLRSLKTVLKPTGAIIASIPNVRNRNIISNLICGAFDYQEQGILDKTHLRFFTFNSVVRMFSEAGYRIETIGPNYAEQADSMIPKWKAQGVPRMLQEVVSILNGASLTIEDTDLMDLFTVQFLLKARPA